MAPLAQLMITDVQAAKALSHLRFASYLRPFMQAPSTMSGAAKDLGVPLNVLHYWVQKFGAWGLIRVSRVQQRKGRAIKFYETTAQRFVIPPELLPTQHTDTMERYWQSTFRAALERAAPTLGHAGGLALTLSEDGQLNVGRIAPDWTDWNPLEAGHPAVLSTWSEGLVLTTADAKELQRDLLGVFQAFQQRMSPAGYGCRYIVYLGLAPLQEP